MRTVTGRSNTTKGQGELKRPYRRLPPLREPIKEPNLVPINQSTWIRKYRGAYINEDINTCPFILYKACIRDFVRHSSMSKNISIMEYLLWYFISTYFHLCFL